MSNYSSGNFSYSIDGIRKYFVANGKSREYHCHSGKVHCIAWNNDGRMLASGSQDKSVEVFKLDRDRLSKDHSMLGHRDSVEALSWNPAHSSVLATASQDKTIRVWDSRSGKLTSTISTKGENINLKWSPRGDTIAVGSKEDLVSFIDTKTWKQRWEEQFKYEINEMGWNNEGNLFFLTTGPGHVLIKSFPDMRSEYCMGAHTNSCMCIEFDPTGRYFATGASDAIVGIWDARHLVCVRTVVRLDWAIRSLCFSHDGRMLVSGSEDLLLDVTDVETGERVLHVPIDAPTFSVCWHPTRYLLAYTCDENKDRGDRELGVIKLFGLPSDT